MLELNPMEGRTMYYGKGDVLTYRTYAKPLAVPAIPETPFQGNDNVIFAHNITFAVTGKAFLPSFTKQDNSMVVATDSMKNFILRQAARFEGTTTEGLLEFVSRRFLETYPHVTAVSVSGERLPFDAVIVRDGTSWKESGLVYRRSRNESFVGEMILQRTDSGSEMTAHRCMLKGLQLIKVKGSSFYGFIRDEYTTLPESFDRPLFIYLDIGWIYGNSEDALGGQPGRYVPAEQVAAIARTEFHRYESPSIQSLIYRIGLRVLQRFPTIGEVFFESNNRTWETVVAPEEGKESGVFTEPRPPFGFQGFSVTREDLEAAIRDSPEEWGTSNRTGGAE